NTGPDAFSDDGAPQDSAAPAAPRRRWPWVAGIAAVAAAAVTAGVLVVGNPAPAPAGVVTAPTASASLTTEPGRTPSASPSVQPSVQQSVQPSVQPTVQPTSPATSPATEGTVAGPTTGRYVSASAGASFDLPDGWTVEESTVRPVDYPGARIIVFNEARMQVAELYHGAAGGVGGACGSGPYTMTELDTAPALDNPWATAAGVRFSYRVLDMRADGGEFDYQIGLVDNVSGQLKDTCLMYSFVAGAPQGTLSFADRAAQSPRHDDPIFNSMAEARDYMLTPEYRKLKGMILSLEMQD
ncbi:MAG TPA: hypothetical protein VLR70_04060, partial [Arthrobacter sp.]|nr:hypothetical protein [Arthrobacter sp.]